MNALGGLLAILIFATVIAPAELGQVIAKVVKGYKKEMAK